MGSGKGLIGRNL